MAAVVPGSLMVRSRLRIARLSIAALVSCLAVRAGALGCPGDCDGNGAITAGELAAGIRAIFDPSAGCLRAFDRDANQLVSVGELLEAVRKSADVCPTVVRVCDTQHRALPIPDGEPNRGVPSVIAVADAHTVGAVAVELEIAHDWIGDLLVTLEHAETGRRVTLIDRPGFPTSPVGCSHADVRCTLEDTAMAAAEDTCRTRRPALLGSLRPSAALAAFAGEPAGGNWTLRVADAVEGDTGTLQHWCLDLQAASTATPTSTPSPTPTLTATASATSTTSATGTARATGTASTTGTPTPTDSAAPSPSPSPTCTATPSATPSSSATVTASPSGTAAPTDTAAPSPSPSESPTDSPSPTPSTTPTASPAPSAGDTPTPPADAPLNSSARRPGPDGTASMDFTRGAG
jgi:subtilisin-like proprotein convertase family protein